MNDPQNENGQLSSSDRGAPLVAVPEKSKVLAGAVLLLAALVAIIAVVANGTSKAAPKPLTQAEDAEFRIPGGPAQPYIAAESVPPAEEPQSLPQGEQSQDPRAARLEAAMRMEAMRLAREQQKRDEERLSAPQLIYDQPASAERAPAQSGGAQLLSGRVEIEQAARLEDLSALIPQGTLVSGILETAIQSDLPGMVRAMVSENVWSFNGAALLIPKGSRLIGRYDSGLMRGQTRVFVIWNRVIRPDGVSVDIASPGTDSLGRAGLTGKVDTHFFERFASSVLLSLIDSGLQAGASAIEGEHSASLALHTGRDFNRAAEIALENSIDIPPTIHVPHGARIKVFVSKDLGFRSALGRSLP